MREPEEEKLQVGEEQPRSRQVGAPVQGARCPELLDGRRVGLVAHRGAHERQHRVAPRRRVAQRRALPLLLWLLEVALGDRRLAVAPKVDQVEVAHRRVAILEAARVAEAERHPLHVDVRAERLPGAVGLSLAAHDADVSLLLLELLQTRFGDAWEEMGRGMWGEMGGVREKHLHESRARRVPRDDHFGTARRCGHPHRCEHLLPLVSRRLALRLERGASELVDL